MRDDDSKPPADWQARLDANGRTIPLVFFDLGVGKCAGCGQNQLLGQHASACPLRKQPPPSGTGG